MNFLRGRKKKRSFYWERWGRRRKDRREEINSVYYRGWERQDQRAQKEVTADQFVGENKLRERGIILGNRSTVDLATPLLLLSWTVISYQQNNSRISGTQWYCWQSF